MRRTVCRRGNVLFTPYTAPEDVRRFMRFDLSCLTRLWYDCRTQSDIMPAAWAQYERELQLPEAAAIEKENPRLVEVLGRDARAVAVLQVIQIARQNEADGYVLLDGRFQPTETHVLQRAKARVLKVLKGGLWHEGEEVTLQAPQREVAFHKSERLIVLLDPIWAETRKGFLCRTTPTLATNSSEFRFVTHWHRQGF